MLQYFGILTIPIIVALIYAVSHFLVFSYEKEVYEIAVRQLAKDSLYELSGVPNFIVADIEKIELKLELGFAYIIVTVSYIVIFFTSFKVYKQLSQMKNMMSEQSFRFQRQITLTLFAQASVPSLCCIVPIGICVTMVVTKANFPGAGAVLSLILSIIPIANPLTTIIIISRYRKACISFFKTRLLSNQVVSLSYLHSNATHNHRQIHL
uniref:G protein-coupled receptor n=1 Tax=Panagrolaimus sp. PS1159 TaxID=55785 RepID=A0AC35GGE5_9BILA